MVTIPPRWDINKGDIISLKFLSFHIYFGINIILLQIKLKMKLKITFRIKS